MTAPLISSSAGELIRAIDGLLPDCLLRDQVDLRRRLASQRRAPAPDIGLLHQLEKQARTSASQIACRRERLPTLTYPDDLPITSRKDEIVEAIRRHPVVVIAGETGSGKTTQLPKICLEAGRGIYGLIGCTQPRRVAALSVSRRIAEELGVAWGREVGCRIRFTDETAPETLIKLMTDGMLLAEIQGDRDLYGYDTIIIDEAHERSLNIDFLLGYLRLLRARRPDLKIIITSATIDTETFSAAFDTAPIIEISGRVYPVEIYYNPMDEIGREEEDFTYIDAALHAVDAVMAERESGDLLVFLPTEKDIHETKRRLEGRSYRHTEILPLFGRLTNADQQRVFHPQSNRRIVVATNVAETSLTIPNIRYVIDTGLARVSRYNPRTHTHRLPIEAISQSSARQRAGRCGRVMGGVCIRLYSEKDLLGRPVYTQPEIQRANLAEVILRLLSLRLGDVYTFPFIDPPRRQAIHGGFLLLMELGAVDADSRLTDKGRAMARLPISPTVARMALQAEQEGALSEVLIIAAGISIPDPRVRPLDRQQAADQEHRKFLNPESDFMTLLNIWNAYHSTLEHLQTQSAMQKFCRTHFLAYNRMREWRDIHEQLRRTLREVEGFHAITKDARYDAIHRSILTGLLSNFAEKKEGNLYRAAHSRDVVLFPGSGLFSRKTVPDKKDHRENTRSPEKTPTPKWIVASEIVETSKLYARGVARIDPRWLTEFGRHLCQASYTEPTYDRLSGRVLVIETLSLYGLQISRKAVSYGLIDPVAATDIFVREALVNENCATPYPFLEHNRAVRQRVETWLLKRRNSPWLDLDEATRKYYADRLEDISSVNDLNRFLKLKKSPDGLMMKDEDLAGGQTVAIDPGAFPDHLMIEGEPLPLAYAFRPGQSEDGVTLTLPFKLVHFIEPDVLEWLVPGLVQEKIEALLRSLPQRLRKPLVPVPDTARRIAETLKPTHRSLKASLAAHIKQHFGVTINPEDWREEAEPDYLRMRVVVTDQEGKSALEGRDIGALQQTLKVQGQAQESAIWRQESERWERYDLRGWTCGDLPERIEVTQSGALPMYGYPGLQKDGDMVHVRLFRDQDEACRESAVALIRLGEIALQEELAWLRRDLRSLRDLLDLATHVGGSEAFQADAYLHLSATLFTRQTVYPLTLARFDENVEQARNLIKRLPGWFLNQMREIAEGFRAARQSRPTYHEREEDLARVLPPDFLKKTPATQLPNLVRYFKAITIRAQRAGTDVLKDQKKTEQIRPFVEALKRVKSNPALDPRLVDDYRWMLEEFRVSVFAQELGTTVPVSPKRLEAMLKEIEG